MTQKWVYFAQETFSQTIKIGSSCYPRDRLDQIRVYCPYHVVLLGYIPADASTETAIQGLFKKQRIHREWFSCDIAHRVQELIVQSGWPTLTLCTAGERENSIAADRLEFIVPHCQFPTDTFSPAKNQASGDFDRRETQNILDRYRLEDHEYDAFFEHISKVSNDLRKIQNTF